MMPNVLLFEIIEQREIIDISSVFCPADYESFKTNHYISMLFYVIFIIFYYLLY